MGSSIKVIFQPLYESFIGLLVFTDSTLAKNSDLGLSWSRAIKSQLAPGFLNKIQQKSFQEDVKTLAELIMLAHDKSFSSAGGFTAWFNELSLEELSAYACVSPRMRETFLPRIEQLRDSCKSLEEWERFFLARIDPGLIEALERDVREKQQLAGTLPAVDFIEQVTGGILVEGLEEEENRVIILSPQYHGRPFNIYTICRGLFVSHYPVDPAMPQPGEPSPQLIRLLATLSDQNRLKILNFLAGEEKSFTEILNYTGLAKSTVHYHLIALRAAGLIRVHLRFNDKKPANFSLRRSALDLVDENLKDFLKDPALKTKE